MKTIYWLHDESLCLPKDFDSANDALIFIWDGDYFAQQGWSLKRLVFIYETLCELPIEIWHGDTLETLSALMQSKQPSQLSVQEAIDPNLNQLINSVVKAIPMQLTQRIQWIDETKLKPCKRFYAYWQQVETQCLPNSLPRKIGKGVKLH